MRRTVLTSDGLELAVVEFGGDGPPILLLHGLMGRASTWGPVARRLTAHGRVLGLDARGHGRSQARGPWTVERMADDAAEVLEPLGPGVVIGHSMGGLHGLALAVRRPDLVRALVVEDMGVDFRGIDAEAAGAWFGAVPQPFGSLGAVREAFGPGVGEYMAECVEERADGYHLLARIADTTAIAAEWAQRGFGDLLPAIRCPVLLIEAAESVTPAGQMAAMARQLVDARHTRIPGTGHLVHAGAPEAHHAAVASFLGALDSGIDVPGARLHTDLDEAPRRTPDRRQPETSTPTTRARTGSTGCRVANASAGRAVVSTQCGSQAPGR